MQRIIHSSSSGFTLLETVVATALLVTALAGLAQLLAVSAHSAHDSGTLDAAVNAAQDKIEELRALDFTYDALGAPLTDPGLALSAGFTLAEDTDDFVDYLNARGAVVDATQPRHGATWTRRWQVTAIGQSVPDAVAIEACVFRFPADGRQPGAASACLATVRVRQP